MSYLGLVNLDYGHLGVLCECARGYWVLVVIFCSSWFITIIIIIFISSLCKIVKNANKNQPSSRYNYSSHATKRTKENARLDIISIVVLLQLQLASTG